MEISIRITNAFTRLVEFESNDSIAEASIDAAHQLYTEAYPNCHVNFVWGEEGKKSFILGVPHNMTQDERGLKDGTIAWEDYAKKWYGL